MALNIINKHTTLTEQAEDIRNALLSLPDNERMFIISDPGIEKHRVIEIHRNSSNNLEYDYETEPES